MVRILRSGPRSIRRVLARIALLGAGVSAAACAASDGSRNDAGSAGAAASEGGGAGSGGVGNGGRSGRSGDSGDSGAGAAGAGRGGEAGALPGSGGEAGDGGTPGVAGRGGAAGANAGSGGQSGGGVRAGGAGGGAAGGTAAPDCRTEGCPSGTECIPSECIGAASCLDPTVGCTDRPVCGCNGTLYASNCEAYAAGVGIGPAEQCATPTGLVPCLDTFCERATEYCDMHRHYGSSAFPVPCQAGTSWTSGRCHPLPAECGADPACSCVSGEPFESGRPAACSPNCNEIDDFVVRGCMTGCFG